MTTLLKSRILMDFLWLADEWAIFSYNNDEGDQPQFLKVKGDIWEDMGKPQSITVTIEPGNLLNG